MPTRVPRTSQVNSPEETALFETLGESAGKAVIFHLGGVASLSDRAKLESGLKSIFGDGASIILNRISDFRYAMTM